MQYANECTMNITYHQMYISILNSPSGWSYWSFVTYTFQIFWRFNQMIRTIQRIPIWKTGWHKRQHKLFVHQIRSTGTWIRPFVWCIRLIIVDCKCGFTSLVLSRQCSIDKFSFLVRWNETCSCVSLLVLVGKLYLIKKDS